MRVLNYGRGASLEGAWIVNEGRLKTLIDTAVAGFFRGANLAFIDTQLILLRNLEPLQMRRPARSLF